MNSPDFSPTDPTSRVLASLLGGRRQHPLSQTTAGDLQEDDPATWSLNYELTAVGCVVTWAGTWPGGGIFRDVDARVAVMLGHNEVRLRNGGSPILGAQNTRSAVVLFGRGGLSVGRNLVTHIALPDDP